MHSPVHPVGQHVLFPATNGNIERRIVPARARGGHRYHGPRQRDQFGHLPSVEWKFQDADVVEDLANAGVPCFNQQSVGLDLDGLGDLADLQGDIEDLIVTHLEYDSGLEKRAESGKGSFEGIRP